ncbi:MAG: prolipoprotein diacylglyceryl transferase [Clostridiales bacterium]
MDYVEFPNFGGLKIDIDRVALKLFNISIYWYGVIIALAFLIGVLLSIKKSKMYKIVPDHIIDILLYATPVAIICARLYYVIFNASEFDSFSDIINIRSGGLAIFGGIIGAFITAIVLCRIKKIDAYSMFDLIAPYLALSQAIGRWGNFINQEAFGSNTNLPWGMTGNSIKNQLTVMRDSGIEIEPNLPVHPTFLYESIWNVMVFILLINFRKKFKQKGAIIFLYMILYGIGRFFIEGLRMDSLMLGNFRISQLLSFVFVLVFGIIFYKKIIKSEDTETYEY